MFVLRISVVLLIATSFGSNAEAQLFRFRSNSARMNAAQQQGYPSTYNAGAYQYTQVQPQTNYVPSQRTMVQGQVPACNRQQMVLVPANSVAALPQQQQQAAQSALQTEVVAVTYRDPYTGRLFQRQYLVQRPISRQGVDQRQAAAESAERQSQGTTEQVMLPESPRQALSQATAIGVTAPKLQPLPKGDVEMTSFESPILVSPDSSPVEFSVLATDEEVGTGSKSVLESSLPILEAPNTSQETPGALLDSDGDVDLNLDLPPLELEDSQ